MRPRRTGGAGPLGGAFSRMTAVKALILANAAVFVLNSVLLGYFQSDILERYFSLYPPSVLSGAVWTLFSYSFLHDGLLHLTVNMLVLYFVGSQLEARLGAARTALIYGVSVFGGAVSYMLLSAFMHVPPLVGASPGVIGVFSAFLVLLEDKKITFLLLFLIPFDMRPRLILYFVAGLELMGFLLFELPARGAGGGVAYSAHLGGLALGVLSALAVEGRLGKLKLPVFSGGRRRRYGSAGDYSYRVNIASDADLRRETNRILDKISSSGFSSLTDAEKRTLNVAKDRLRHL